MEALKEIIDLIHSGGWVAFATFGMYLGYKLSLTTVITYGVVKLAQKVVEVFSSGNDAMQRIYQVVAAANMRWPLTPEEWAEIEKRVRPTELRKVA